MIGVGLYVGKCFDFSPSRREKIVIAAALTDALISISALVVGVLGAISMIHGMPPAASYTLIVLSAVIILVWIALTVISKGELLCGIKELCMVGSDSDSAPITVERPRYDRDLVRDWLQEPTAEKFLYQEVF